MFLVFFAFWIILNGKITTEIILFGIAISAIIYLFIWKLLGYSPKNDLFIFKNFFLILTYIALLEYEILKANFLVIGIIFKSSANSNAKIVKFDVDLESDFLKTVLANSITLTPGTITISVDQNTFTVHCLDGKLADGIEDSSFVKLLKKMEKKI